MSEICYSLAQTAEWRRLKAEKHPADTRNIAAAALLDQLASMSASVELEQAYITARDEYLGSDEAISEALREIGFHSHPATLDDLLKTVTERIRSIDQTEAKRKLMESTGLAEEDL